MLSAVCAADCNPGVFCFTRSSIDTGGREERHHNADEDGAVVTDAAEVAGAGIGPERLLAGVGGVTLRQERRFQDGEGRRTRQRRRYKAQIDQLPLSVETNAAVAP